LDVTTAEVIATLVTVVQLVFLEGILSIDNAAVLGAMVLHLPDDRPIPWPSWLPYFRRHAGELLGMQRQAALRVGLLGAYGGRALMLLLAGVIINVPWVRILGAVYLLYLGVSHVGSLYRNHEHEAGGDGAARRVRNGFWATVTATVFADLAFSVDNVIAAVALSSELWVVLLGVAIGMLLMRFAASVFSRAIGWEPALETGAYLLLLAIGSELLLSEIAGVTVARPVQFAISLVILGLTLLFARTRLRAALVVFRPVLALFAAIDWAVEGSKGLLLAPFRRRLHSGERRA
jgi:tellurite resistance protein TerC